MSNSILGFLFYFALVEIQPKNEDKNNQHQSCKPACDYLCMYLYIHATGANWPDLTSPEFG